jgi:hypothetical protein
MDVDIKSSLGSYGGAGNSKKRPISFRLTVPSKRQSLPYHQRASASTYHTFYVSRDGSAAPDTPTSSTAFLEEDPFYDSDTDYVPSFLHSTAESHYLLPFEQQEAKKKPMFTKPVTAGANSSGIESQASSSAGPSRPGVKYPESVYDRLSKSYEVVESQELFKDSPMWSALLEAKQSGPSDPRFTPKLMSRLKDSMTTSVVLKLHPTGFSFNELEQIYPYVRNYVSVMDAINYGILVGQLETSLPKTLASNVDGVSRPALLHFYDGGIIVEVHDYREGRAIISSPGTPAQPHKTKLFLRPDHHGILHFIDNQPVAPRVRSIVEQHLVWYLHPDLHLKPDPEETAFLWSLHFSFLQSNIPYKNKLTKRRNALGPARTRHVLPSVIQYDSGESEMVEDLLGGVSGLPRGTSGSSDAVNGADNTMSIKNEGLGGADEASDTQNGEEDAMMVGDGEGESLASLKPVSVLPQPITRVKASTVTKKSKLFSHLQSINFAPDYHKEADTGQSHSEKKRPSSDKADPNLKEAVLSHPQVVGHFLFTIQPRYPQTSQQPPLDYATLEINNRSAGSSQPFEMMHTSLRYSNGKALHFQSGGPAATQRLLNQFKKLETPATNEQVKHWQTPPARPSGSAAPPPGTSHPPGPPGPPGASAPHPHAHLAQPGPGHVSTPPQGQNAAAHAANLVPHSPAGQPGTPSVGTPGAHHPMTPGAASGPGAQNAMAVDSPSGAYPGTGHPGSAPQHAMQGATGPAPHMLPSGAAGPGGMGARNPMPLGQPPMRQMIPQSMHGAVPHNLAQPGASPTAKQAGAMPGRGTPLGAPPSAHVPGSISMYPMKQTGAIPVMNGPPPGSGAASTARMAANPKGLPSGQPGMPGATVVGAASKYGAPMPNNMARPAGALATSPATTKFAVGPPVGAPRPVSVKASTPVSASPSNSPAPGASASPANRRTVKKK